MTASLGLANLSSSSMSAAAGGTSIDALRSAAARDPKAAIKETARQFEALLMQQLMKSMREATLGSGMLDNEGTKLGTEMLDSQYATKMAGLPGGLADAIARQLERQTVGDAKGDARGAVKGAAFKAPGAVDDAREANGASASLSQQQVDFVRAQGDAARVAEGASGIPAAFMLAQAAHETGWGRREIRNADGTSSNNFFGIKATAGWTGAVAEVTTTEWIGGEPQKVTARFRAYASAADSFKDYARLITESPRYADVAARLKERATGSTSAASTAALATDFAQGLQRAGYATDPAYASKLARTINTTLRVQKAVA